MRLAPDLLSASVLSASTAPTLLSAISGPKIKNTAKPKRNNTGQGVVKYRIMLKKKEEKKKNCINLQGRII